MSGNNSAVVIGATGGIGGAFADALEEEETFAKVWRFGRSLTGAAHLDVTDADSIAAAAATVAKGPAPSLILVATGIMGADGHGPEESFSDLDPQWLAQMMAINAIGPAMIARHFLPLMPKRGTPVFAALTARLGSISENRQGGSHGYRASKAALNMFIRTCAIDAARQYERAIVVGLHPGNVDTPLSRYSREPVAAGRLLTPDRAALQLLDVIEGLKPVDSGKCFSWDGSELPA